MTKKRKSETSVALPLSLTDTAKAVKELIEVVRAAFGFVDDSFQLYRKFTSKKRAKDLASLYFPPNGMLAQLIRIEQGEIDNEIIRALLGRLHETQKIDDAVARLEGYEDVIRIDFGMKKSTSFSHLNHRKVDVRQRIAGFITRYAEGKTKKNILRAEAREIIGEIESINQNLVAWHDEILPPRGPASGKVRKRTGRSLS